MVLRSLHVLSVHDWLFVYHITVISETQRKPIMFNQYNFKVDHRLRRLPNIFVFTGTFI